ncbi:44608_t:CDS:1 [Gigaspora margarita]|uniref:44608_t:CDS:1 n=1 Tax=Gigaspora margarita TaxID=4874 RepID=A0ABN7VNJ3_GIGMA|nr:44608_t:CDS:1 [Gigaspora margarita]
MFKFKVEYKINICKKIGEIYKDQFKKEINLEAVSKFNSIARIKKNIPIFNILPFEINSINIFYEEFITNIKKCSDDKKYVKEQFQFFWFIYYKDYDKEYFEDEIKNFEDRFWFIRFISHRNSGKEFFKD